MVSGEGKGASGVSGGSSGRDGLGMALSGFCAANSAMAPLLCAAHCAATPLLGGLGAFCGGSGVIGEGLENILVYAALGIAGWALGSSRARHGSIGPLALGFAGGAALLWARHGLDAGSGWETRLMVSGSLGLVAAHGWNLALGRGCRCGDSDRDGIAGARESSGESSSAVYSPPGSGA